MDPTTGIDISQFSEYPLVGIVVGIVVWMMYFFKAERKEMGERFESMNDKQTVSLDKNTEAITQLTLTNRSVKSAVSELREDIKRETK